MRATGAASPASSSNHQDQARQPFGLGQETLRVELGNRSG